MDTLVGVVGLEVGGKVAFAGTDGREGSHRMG